jgi:hypothetical protein
LSGRVALRASGISVFCLLLLCAVPSAAAQQNGSSRQKDYALIYGTVWGPDDQPVPGIHVSIRKAEERKPRWQVISNRRGEFDQRVPVGAQDYVVEADLKLPKGQPRPQLTVHIDDNERKDISLHLTQEQVSRK